MTQNRLTGYGAALLRLSLGDGLFALCPSRPIS
ncbi:hypothetical protein EV132_1115 [Rhizobium sullae]|uniref:Uncharacterized protein n=1 Tax=Rhizobium sullae TaxID=50338 RepID=A0A4R3PZR3_RHISU|nr:hypothetical protein EV132_1115 [Rhizobium sullae]